MHYNLCIMGNPVHSSQSPWIHEAFARQVGVSLCYSRIQPEAGHFPVAVTAFREKGGYGLNVTAPFKQEAWELATEVSARASVARSVNTITFREEGEIYGDNTDGVGLINDLTRNFGVSLAGKRILILGAGGAVRGILHPLLSQNPLHITLVNRSFDNARKLVAEFESFGRVSASLLEELEHAIVDVVIDGTAAGAKVALPSTLALAENSLCYDLKYDQKESPFWEWAKARGCQRRVDGLGMLVEQAAEAFWVWTGKRPETRSIIKWGWGK